MASSEAAEPVSETEAGGGVGGEAADGPGHAPIPVRAGRPGRGLAVYLAHPRPDAWAKALIAPACFVLAAASTGRFSGWPRLLLLWLVLELLIYPARYQWNDIRGLDADRRHPEHRARSRLPGGSTGQARRHGVRVSAVVATLRIVLALLIGAAAGLLGQVALLAAAVLATAACYEFLRSLPGRPTRVPAAVQAVAVWLAVGLGYLVRGGLGLGLAGLAWGSPAMVAGLACVASFGIMFVLLTWALEATSYCEEDAAGGWHPRPDLAGKPHLAALLRYTGRPVTGAAGPGPSRYGGNEPVLRDRGRLLAPWNLALAAAAAAGAAQGLALSRPAAGGAGGYLAVTAAGLAGAVLLARCRDTRGRWLIAAAWAPVLVATALAAAPGRPVLAGIPWLAISGVYAALRGWSYRDLLTASPGGR
jgi:4-hydroxybenzoate polyprenyltransferase